MDVSSLLIFPYRHWVHDHCYLWGHDETLLYVAAVIAGAYYQMKITGIEKFREKIPILAGKKIFSLPLYAICIVSLCILAMIGFDSIPDLTDSSGANPILLSFFPLIGVLIIGAIGLVLVYQMWFWRKVLKAKYGPLSCQHIFLVGFAGVACMISLSVNLYVHFWACSIDRICHASSWQKTIEDIR